MKRRIENVRGVGSVALVGESTREIQVVVDRPQLEAYHVSLAEVVSALQRENVDIPAGSADRGATEALVRVAARGRTAADIGAIAIKRPGGSPILVSDVAQVIDGVEQPKNVALLDERPALALDIQKQSGANTVAVAEGVVAAVEKLKPELPPGITLSIIKDDSSFIREAIEDVNTTMIIGGLLTVFIVYLFLNSWRSTIITGVTLPISVVSGFIAMRAFGFTLNVLTLMGLSLAIGMLIDDAIVVRENIVRHLQRGKDHFDAARDGTAEIGLAVMATTFTILAVFVPVAFMAGHGRPDLLRVRNHGGGRGGGLALRQLHARPDALLALVRPRHRAGLPPALRRPHAQALQRVVRGPAPDLRARAGQRAAAPACCTLLAGAPLAFLVSLPILGLLGERLHARLRPRRVPGACSRRRPARPSPRRATAPSRWCGCSSSCRRSTSPTPRSARPVSCGVP